MRRIVFISLTTMVAVVLLFSYHTSTNTAAVPGPAVKRQGSSSGYQTGTNTAAAPAPAAKRKVSASGAGSATFTGDAADTRWGLVQVRITVQGGRITTSEAVQHPQENRRDVQINDYALPILSQRALQAQSASIDTVSGATVTSDGYRRSLQSAIDQAHL
jgi:uncharacterized protein with FMN-binding domain